jgi:hypothetical protein
VKLLRLLIGLAAVLALPLPASSPHIITISCSSATVRLSTSSISARWVQMVAPAGNSAVVRWGDNTTSTSLGTTIAAGGGQFLPPGQNVGYSLNLIYVYCTSGDTLNVVWGD